MDEIILERLSDMVYGTKNDEEHRANAKTELFMDAAKKMQKGKLYLVMFDDMEDFFDKSLYKARLEIWKQDGVRAYSLGGYHILIPPKRSELTLNTSTPAKGWSNITDSELDESDEVEVTTPSGKKVRYKKITESEV